jgi:hypothetical protein
MIINGIHVWFNTQEEEGREGARKPRPYATSSAYVYGRGLPALNKIFCEKK